MAEADSILKPPCPPGRKKLEISSIAKEGDTCVTFMINDEDHTLGNALRYIIMKNPDTEFCGYTIPHPSEERVALRIQTRNGVSATAVLRKGLRDLMQACDHVGASLQAGVHAYRDHAMD